MTSNNAEVSSAALIELQTDLTHLSEALHELFDLMNADMTQVGEAWRDGKYEEFVSGYRQQINKCEEISLRYNEWCKRVLAPTIEKVVAVETTSVDGDGGGSTGGVSGGGVTDSGSRVVSGVKNRGFNLGTPGTKSNKVEKMHEGTERVKELTRKKFIPKPDSGGFETPQNERKYSPIQMDMLLNGRQR